MDNQHRKIKGYRELSQEDIDLMNQIKEQGVELGKLVDKLFSHNMAVRRTTDTPGMSQATLDAQEWIITGKKQLQQGLMALTRSVAKPDFF